MTAGAARYFHLSNSLTYLSLLAAFAAMLSAKRLDRLSVAGALIDPFADRVFVLTAISAYLIDGVVSTPQYFIFLSRDIATAVGFVVARFIPGLGASAFQARMLGKTVTVLQLIILVAVLHFERATGPLIAIIGGLSAISIVDYTVALARARSRARQASR